MVLRHKSNSTSSNLFKPSSFVNNTKKFKESKAKISPNPATSTITV
jgi:hypothetical protein